MSVAVSLHKHEYIEIENENWKTNQEISGLTKTTEKGDKYEAYL